MEIIRSIGLVLVILLAFNHFLGGRPENILRPAWRLGESILGFFLAAGGRILGSLFRAGIGKSVNSGNRIGGATRKPPPRW